MPSDNIKSQYWSTCGYGSISENPSYYSNSGYVSNQSYFTSSGYGFPQKPEFVLQMEEAIAEGERQEQKNKEKIWQKWLDSKIKESLY